MTNPKPINFRPSEQDQLMIDKLISHYKQQTKSDVLRLAIYNLSYEVFGKEKLGKILADHQLNKKL